MPSITAAAARTIDAPAATVYDVLADYHHGHPRILPEQYFSDLVVEEGGRGEGTVIRFRMHMLGGSRVARARVAEPVPGRVLTETYPENGAVTTFDVEPLDGGRRTRLTITTSWVTAGLQGVVERWVVPPLLRRVFRAEMARLDHYVQNGAAPERDVRLSAAGCHSPALPDADRGT